MRKFLDNISKFIASFFGIGFIPLMPGTFGSLAGAGIYYLLRNNEFIFYTLLFFLAVAGFMVSAREEIAFKKKDSRLIVIDEVVGAMISFIAVPFNMLNLVIVFVLFRIFDVFKPYPIRLLEKAPAGFGVILDDVAAGICSNIVFQVAFRLLLCKAV